MSRPCRVYGCAGHASRFGLYCPAHKSALRRHGHPEQDAITKAELKPYVAQVRRRVARNAENATWSHCEARWRAIVDLARGIIAEAERGQAGNRHERSAAARGRSARRGHRGGGDHGDGVRPLSVAGGRAAPVPLR